MLPKQPEQFNITIGKKLKDLRLKRGYSSQEVFAWQNNIDRTHYSKLERGALDVRVSTLKRILDSLDTSLAEFFTELEK